MKVCQTYDVCFIFNIGNKNLGIYCHLSLILCYFLTSKLPQNVNFAPLGHFGQHVVLTICV